MDITLMYTPEEKKAFEEEQESRFFWIRYAKQLKAYTTREEELDVKRKRAFREFESAKEKYTEKLKIVEAITYQKHLDKRRAEEAAMDPKKFEALFHSEDEKKAP